MRRAIVLLALGLASSSASADAWYNVALFTCNAEKSNLEIRHFGAYNEAGEALLKVHAGSDNLFRAVGAKDIGGSDWRTFRNCTLNGIAYQIETQPLKTGISATGECGAWNSARVRITSNGKELANVILEEWCSSSEVVSRIAITGDPPTVVINRISADKYYGVAP
jgi:hypothetical protein